MKDVRDVSIRSAKAAGLRYVSDTVPGLRRERAGAGFRYKGVSGTVVKDAATIHRVQTLAIPPAWTAVWICPDARGHIQASGRDAKGRKQYRYHAHWRLARDETKYDRLLSFSKALPGIRRRVSKDMSRPGLPLDKVLAAVVGLLEKSLIRVGNEEYAKSNNSYGLTTMQDRHAQVRGGNVQFAFKGKSGVRHVIDLQDRRLAKIVKRCQDLPGQDLMQYIARDGTVRDISSDDVNDYLKRISGEEFTAKDFRTWAGTVLCMQSLCDCEPCKNARQAKQNVLRAIESVAARLGNTRAVCRKSYIHPVVLDAYLDGEPFAQWREGAAARAVAATRGLLPKEERLVVELLMRRKKQLKAPAARAAA